MERSVLQQTIKKLLVPGKGILAADESVETIGKRFDKLGVENTEPNREGYREMLFTTPGISDYISGVILYDETLHEKTSEGVYLRDILKKQKIILGCKVDQGLVPMLLSKDEFITKGLEGLRDRLHEYYSLGVRFAKWRAVFSVGGKLPSERCIKKNSALFVSYARMCQEAGIVPIVEPEVLSDGNHTVKDCYHVTRKVQTRIFEDLQEAGVDITCVLLKPNMVVPGSESEEKSTPEKVANYTVSCLKAVVPQGVPGIVFLSVGQTEKEACLNLSSIGQQTNMPWVTTFSFGRALQNSAMQEWGKKGKIDKAQKVFLERARLASLAQLGKYTQRSEKKKPAE